MSTATRPPEPGSPSWRDRFLVMSAKGKPFQLVLHDTLHQFDAYYEFRSASEIQHFVNQLRNGYTDVAPTGTLYRPRQRP